jgi:hypothetical protein
MPLIPVTAARCASPPSRRFSGTTALTAVFFTSTLIADPNQRSSRPAISPKSYDGAGITAAISQSFAKLPNHRNLFLCIDRGFLGPDDLLGCRKERQADFMDNVEQLHETVRTSPPWIAELDYLQKEMRPIAELCTGERSHLFVRGLTVAHFDAVLKQNDEARRFRAGDIQTELASRGVEAFVHAAA